MQGDSRTTSLCEKTLRTSDGLPKERQGINNEARTEKVRFEL